MTPIFVILWKENKNLQKRGKYAKSTKIGFMKTGCPKKKVHLRKIDSYEEQFVFQELNDVNCIKRCLATN